MLVKLVWLLVSLGLPCAAREAGARGSQDRDPQGLGSQSIGAQAAVRLPLDAADEIDGAQFAFLEASTPSEVYFVQQPIHLTLRLGIDLEFLKSNILQLFTQTLDVPVQLHAPWIDKLPGAQSRAHRLPAPQRNEVIRVSLVVNEQIADAVRVADQERGGRKFAVFEIERTYFAQSAERLTVPAARLRFARATRFQTNIIADPVPLDLQLASVAGNALELQIRPLPEEGRPIDFGGAVGQFEVSADVATLTPAVGESLKLLLRIGGDGNLEFLRPPRLDQLNGFQLRGMLDEQDAQQRIVTYDLAPTTTDVKEVPSIALSYFDTGVPNGYRTLHTEPIALDVRPGPKDPKYAQLKAVPPGSSGRVGQAPEHAVAATRRALILRIVAITAVLMCVGLLIAVWIRRERRIAKARDGTPG